jgi:hypothetical protein
MPAIAPPADCPSPGGPLLRTLRAGSVWWRIHRGVYGPTAFRDTGAEAKRADPITNGADGRFDCQAGEYGYLYASETKPSTIAEAFLRGPVVADPAARFLRRAKLTGQVLSRIELTVDLAVIDMCGAVGLARIGQDAWLTACDEPDYPLTQQWATAVRRWAPPPSIAGLVWMSKRDNVHNALVLFADGVPVGGLSGRVHRELDSGLGKTLVTKTLARFAVTIK